MKSAELLRTLGEMIRSNRVRVGLTQSSLGERAGIVGKYVSEIERGTRDVPISTLQRIVEPGLGMRLEIALRDPRREVGSGEDVTRLVGALPAEVRLRVSRIVREIVELVR